MYGLLSRSLSFSGTLNSSTLHTARFTVFEPDPSFHNRPYIDMYVCVYIYTHTIIS